MTKKAAKTGKELERRIANAYRQMGARKVEHDVELAGHQIDVYVELETADRSLHRIAVEAKDYTSPVGIEIVREFSGVVDRLRRERVIDDGIIVSAAGFSKQARNAAKTDEIRLLESADLDAMVAHAKAGEQPRPAYTPLPPPGADELLEPGLLPLGSRLPFYRHAQLLQKIGFDYEDSPTKHGWRVSDETQFAFRHFRDDYVESAIEIKSRERSAMDYDVKPLGAYGSLVNFLVKLDSRRSIVYACLNVSSKPQDVWLNFPVRKGLPSPHGDGSSEWEYPVQPTRPYPETDWLLLEIDLDEAVKRTYGTLEDECEFERMIRFRLRGNLSLAHISIFESQL